MNRAAKPNFRYVKEMGLNTIRLEGKLEDESSWTEPIAMEFSSWPVGAAATAWEKWGKWSEETKTSIRVVAARPDASPSARIRVSCCG